MMLCAHVRVHYVLRLELFMLRGSGVHLLGTEYIAAMPARKSRAKPFPPVAEAAYGP
jgi:hypothetical protein